MNRPLLPPQGFISNLPIGLFFNQQISDSAKVTWLQLRALAWGVDETPEFSSTQFEEWTGKSQSTLYAHMRLLRSGGALRWRQGSKSTFIVYDFVQPSVEDGDIFQNSTISEKPFITDQEANSEEKERTVDSEIPESRKTDLLFEALADVSGRTPPDRDWQKLPGVVRGILNKSTAQLRKVDATPDQVSGFWAWWKVHDFRGQKNKRPDPWEVVKQWTVYLNSVNGAQHANTEQPSEHQKRIAARVEAIQRAANERTGT